MNKSQCLGICLLLILLNSLPPASAETLEEAWEAAAIHNWSLKSSQEEVNAAHEELAATKAARLPRVSVDGSYKVLDETPAMEVPQEMVDQAIAKAEDLSVSLDLPWGLPSIPLPTDIDIPGFQVPNIPMAEKESLSYGAIVEIPVFTSGKINNGIKASQAMLEAARSDSGTAAQDLRMNVSEAYILILRAQNAVKIAEAYVDSLMAHAGDAADFYEQGYAAKNDFLASQVALADGRQSLSKAKNARDLAGGAYNRLLGRPLDAPVFVEEVRRLPVQDSLDALTKTAMKNRSELKSIETRVEALNYSAKMKKAGLLPQVGVSGGYQFTENKYQAHEGIWAAGLGVKWELFDGGVSLKKAGADRRKAMALEYMKKDVRSGIALQVRKAWLDSKEAKERVSVSEKALDQADENLRVAQDRYKAGLSTNTEVLDAQTLRAKAMNNHNEAVYDWVLATYRLGRATGAL
ncbi:TolC family protein [Desulfatibacillum aliphaticivorans]|uniref:TolC family protein n=1 Tax=Desulfatibacillum aliphaticivorans TaxID=218208 RepID=UPI00041C8B9A|nr:TolC family protein [Desulfatibacillum aliphaticivorans]